MAKLSRPAMGSAMYHPAMGRLIHAAKNPDGQTLGVIGVDACSGMSPDFKAESTELRFQVFLDDVMDPDTLRYINENFKDRSGHGQEPGQNMPSQNTTAPMSIESVVYDTATGRTKILLNMDLDRVYQAIESRNIDRAIQSGRPARPSAALGLHLMAGRVFGAAVMDPVILSDRIAVTEAQNYLMNGRLSDFAGNTLTASDIQDMAHVISDAAGAAVKSGGNDPDAARLIYSDALGKAAADRGISGRAMRRAKSYAIGFQVLSDQSSGEAQKLVPMIAGRIDTGPRALGKAMAALNYPDPRAVYSLQALNIAAAMRSGLNQSRQARPRIERFPDFSKHWPAGVDTLHGVAGLGYGNIKAVNAGGVNVYCTDHLADAFSDYAFELHKQYTEGRDSRRPAPGIFLNGDVIFNGACGPKNYIDAAGRGYIDKGRGPEPELLDGFHVIRSNKDFLMAAYDNDDTRYACKDSHYFIKADRDLAVVHHNRPGCGPEYPKEDMIFKIPAGSWVNIESFENFRTGLLDRHDQEHLFKGDIVPAGQEVVSGLTVLAPGKKPTDLVEACERFDRAMSGVPGFSDRYMQLRDNQDITFKPWPNEATGVIGRPFGKVEKRALTAFEQMHQAAALSMPLMPENAVYVPEKIPGLDYNYSETDLGECDLEDVDKFYSDRAAEFIKAADSIGAVPSCLEVREDGKVYVSDIKALESNDGHSEVLAFGIKMNTYVETKEVRASRVTRNGSDTGLGGVIHGQATWLDFAEKTDGCKGNEFFEYMPVLSIAEPSPEIDLEKNTDDTKKPEKAAGNAGKRYTALEQMRAAMARNSAREAEHEIERGLDF